jgi:hypothetical protein
MKGPALKAIRNLLLLLLGACAPLTPYRTEWPTRPIDCSPDAKGAVPSACGNSILETAVKARYELLITEFDDQGLQYPDPKEFTGGDGAKVGQAREQINLVMKHLGAMTSANENLSLLVFIHGWKNNAAIDNGNLMSFRKVLASLAISEEARGAAARRVVGIFVSWRGLSATLEPFEAMSFWDRKFTAQHVAEGSVRALFARLRNFQCKQNDPNAGDGCWSRKPGESPKVRMLLVGHSFGGLILYNAIAEDLIESVTSALDKGPNSAPVPRFGDMVVLLNPAFEASRYTPLYRAAERAAEFKNENYRAPIFVSVTTKADWATRYAFPAGRFFNTLFEKTASAEESEANTNTIGHVERYITHKLEKVDQPGCNGWSGGLIPSPSNPTNSLPPSEEAEIERLRVDLRLEQASSATFFNANLKDQKLPNAWVRSFCGGTKLTHVRNDPNSLIWNIETDGNIMSGHSDITNPALVSFIRQLYQDVEVFPNL